MEKLRVWGEPVFIGIGVLTDGRGNIFLKLFLRTFSKIDQNLVDQFQAAHLDVNAAVDGRLPNVRPQMTLASGETLGYDKYQGNHYSFYDCQRHLWH